MSEFNKKVGKYIEHDVIEKYKRNWKHMGGCETESSFIGADIIDKLRATPGFEGFRIYYGLDDDGRLQPIFYAADITGKPIVTSSGKDGGNANGADATMACPPYCPK
jgi:hypothetical protein